MGIRVGLEGKDGGDGVVEVCHEQRETGVSVQNPERAGLETEGSGGEKCSQVPPTPAPLPLPRDSFLGGDSTVGGQVTQKKDGKEGDGGEEAEDETWSETDVDPKDEGRTGYHGAGDAENAEWHPEPADDGVNLGLEDLKGLVFLPALLIPKLPSTAGRKGTFVFSS